MTYCSGIVPTAGFDIHEDASWPRVHIAPRVDGQLDVIPKKKSSGP